MLSDYTVRLWDVASGNQTASLDGNGAVGFGDFLIFASAFGKSTGSA